MKKNILILGGFGFIGTNLTQELLKRGNYEIIIFETKEIQIQNPDPTLKHQSVLMGLLN